MPLGSLLFMLASWTLVLSLTGWAFYRLLKAPPPGALPPEAEVFRGEESPTVRTL